MSSCNFGDILSADEKSKEIVASPELIKTPAFCFFLAISGANVNFIIQIIFGTRQISFDFESFF